MKKTLLSIALYLLACMSGYTQVICIFCYNQNEGIAPLSINNLILNGGFELSTCDTGMVICPNSGYYACDLDNWTCTGGSWASYPKLYNNSYTLIPEGNKGLYLGNYYCRACSETYNDISCIINNNDCTASGPPLGFPLSEEPQGGETGVSIEQSVSGLLVGTPYILEFWAGGEWNYQIDGLFAIDLGFGNIMLRNPRTPPDSGIGTRYLIVFKPTAATHIFKFTNWGHISAVASEVILDDIRLYLKDDMAANCATDVYENVVMQQPVNYPNPATNQITINALANTNSEIAVYNVMGDIVFKELFIGSITFNINQLNSGLYLYRIQNKYGTFQNGSFIKE